MKSSPWLRLVGPCVALIAIGVGIDVARAQYPQQCQSPMPGCTGGSCFSTSGTCVGPNAPNYTAVKYVAFMYMPCTAGEINNCANIQVKTCTANYYTGTPTAPCDNLVCTFTATSSGC